MGYVTKNLLGNETILSSANVHWFILIRPIIFMMLGIALFFSRDVIGQWVVDFIAWVFKDPPTTNEEIQQMTTIRTNTALWLVRPLAFAMLFYGIISFIKNLIYRLTTELVITNSRIIAKWGLISRDTVELNTNQIESVIINQSVIGRLFNFGTVRVQGTGQAVTPFYAIADPLLFRRQAAEAISR